MERPPILSRYRLSLDSLSPFSDSLYWLPLRLSGLRLSPVAPDSPDARPQGHIAVVPSDAGSQTPRSPIRGPFLEDLDTVMAAPP